MKAHASALASVLLAAVNSKYNDIQTPSPAAQNALQLLEGEEISAGNSVISFGIGAQVGEVTVRDVVGGNIIHFNLNIPKEMANETPEYYIEAGNKHLESQSFELAIESYTKSIALRPNSKAFQKRADAYLGMLLYKSGTKVSTITKIAAELLGYFSKNAHDQLLHNSVKSQLRRQGEGLKAVYDDICQSIVHSTTGTEEREMREYRILFLSVCQSMSSLPLLFTSKALNEDVKWVLACITSNEQKEQYRFIASNLEIIYKADRLNDPNTRLTLELCQSIAVDQYKGGFSEENLPLFGHIEMVRKYNEHNNTKAGQETIKSLAHRIMNLAEEMIK